ncbi:hypothetical protein F5879DRAFT_201981 [Lentinula edodes]|nr:hypothetical protein F5879DRAFT_201981 [Lentinula edodes]
MTQALSGSCQSCLHKVRISRGSSDNDSSEPEENPSTDNRRSKRRIGRPKKIPSNNVTRFCANSSCGNPLPLDYSYKRCQPCIRAYHERYRMNIACAGRCGARIPRNSSLKTCSACRKGGHKNRSPRLCRRYKKCGNSLPVASPFKSCASCLEYDREQRRQRVARASRVTNRDSDVGDRDSNDIWIAVTPQVHETIVIDLSSEGEDEELEENPHQELESHNAQVKELETELIRAKKKASQKLPSLTEQLNYADSRLESFMQHGHRVDLTNDTHSQLVEFEEKKQLKQENERLHKEITGKPKIPMLSLSLFF